jgi:putative colanic acid biosynthesis acetyltransferase WcaB
MLIGGAELFGYIFQDFSVNRGSPKIAFSLVLFRLAQLFARKKGTFIWWLGLPLMALYRVIVEWIFSLELRPDTQVGPCLKIEHGFALVINDNSILGKNVHLRHSTTIGCVKRSDGSQGPSPTIGNNVEVGANSVILGGVIIGDGAKIGAGSVVVNNVPAGAVVVGNPARVIKLLRF